MEDFYSSQREEYFIDVIYVLTPKLLVQVQSIDEGVEAMRQ